VGALSVGQMGATAGVRDWESTWNLMKSFD
jgi:hypothetical protein